MRSLAETTVAVIGAGIVGTTTALNLLRAGLQVTLIDAQPPGNGTSFGNAGMISPDACVPRSYPALLYRVPRMLMDPNGPLTVRPSYVWKALPWFARWALECRMERVVATSDALLSLHSTVFDCYRELLGPNKFADLIKINGHLYYWDGARPGNKQSTPDFIYSRHKVVKEALDVREVQKLVPALTTRASYATLFPRGGHTVNPHRLVRTIASLFTEAGGAFRQERVLKISPEGDRYRLVTGIANHLFDRIVIATGAWSQRLLAPLGYRLPLETERGYHITIPRPHIETPALPIVCENLPSASSPVDDGLRCAGTAEFAGLDAPMNEQRSLMMLRSLQDMLPGLKTDGYSIWMGHRPSFPDSLPVIDEAPKHRGLLVAFGHAHNGMTGAAMTGKLITELLLERKPSIDLRPFRMTRF